MRKPIYSFICIFSFLGAGLTIHQAFAQRSPSVEPVTEVSIEEDRAIHAPGYDFADKMAEESVKTSAERVPANIATKAQSSPYSYIGPLIFLIALPMALWIVVAKKMKQVVPAKKVDYFSKTTQFKPYKTEYQEQDVDDDQDYPKAS